MCRVTSTDVGRSTADVARARQFVVGTLRQWALDALVPDAELLTSELVTNALVHAGGSVVVTVAVADGTAEVGVTDRSAVVPRPRRVPPTAEGGRGLAMVDLIAREWGVSDVEDGKQVWFRLDVDASWEHRSDCSSVVKAS